MNANRDPGQGASEATRLLGDFLRTTQDFLFEVGDRLDVNQTDFKALRKLIEAGPMTVGELSNEVGLTSGSTTAMLNRIIKVGHASKQPSEHDGRSSIVVLNPESASRAISMIGPMFTITESALQDFSEDDRAVVLKFLATIAERAEQMLADLKASESQKVR